VDPDALAADIEGIRRLKARYFRLMDTKQWDEWAELFVDEARLRYGPGHCRAWRESAGRSFAGARESEPPRQ
jgi:hypothetical protein